MHLTQLWHDEYLFELHHGLGQPYGLRLSIPLIDENKLAIENQDIKFFKAISSLLSDVPRLEAIEFFDGFDTWFCQGNKLHKAIEHHPFEKLEEIKKQALLVLDNIEDKEARAYKNAIRFLAALQEI